MEFKKQMPCLDIIRIYACLCVVAVHIAIVFNVPGRIGQIMQAGSNGLGVFYILSGFLIFLSLDKYKVGLWGWYKKRIIRIFPLYYFMILVYIIFYVVIVKDVPADSNHLYWLSYFLCLNKIVKKSCDFWYNLGALSSMSVFIWFYITAPVLKKIITGWQRSLIFLILSYALHKIFVHTTWLSIMTSLYYIAMGIFVYYAVKESKERSTAIICLCLVCFLMLASSEGGLGYGLCISLLIMITCNISITNDKINGAISFLSKRTFAIYLGHTFVMQIMQYYNLTNGMKGFIIFLVGTIIMIAILHEAVENLSVKLLS